MDAGGDDDETARTQKDDENGAVVGKHDLRDEEAIES